MISKGAQTQMKPKTKKKMAPPKKGRKPKRITTKNPPGGPKRKAKQ